MCIVFCCVDKSEEFPFILISNRDEFFIRKTAPASFTNSVVCPKDIARSDGGTWIGLNTKNGSVCCLVNYRESSERISPVSRGRLPVIYLNESADEFFKFYHENLEHMGGFSFLYGNLKDPKHEMNVVSNRAMSKEFKNGSIFGLSNSKIDEPWPKVKKGEALLTEVMAEQIKDKDVLIEKLFAVLCTDDMPPNATLEDAPSSIFIHPITTTKPQDGRFFGEFYGTRTQTIILVDKLGHITYLEKTLYDDDNLEIKQEVKKFESNLWNDKM